MKKKFLKWFQWLASFGLICLVLIFSLAGCGSLEQSRNEGRVRHYFALGSHDQVTDSAITSALQSRFPVGTPVEQLKTWLAGQGLGVDGRSRMWQTNQCVSYQVDDYSDAWFSMRHTQVTATFDNQQKIQNIQAQVYSYGL